MKVSAVLLFITIFSFTPFSQYRSKKYSLSFNAGMNSVIDSEFTGQTKPSFYSSLTGRAMFNTHFGVMTSIGLNSFASTRKLISPTKLMNANLQLVYNLHFIRIPTQSFGVLLHGGAGLATMWNSEYSQPNTMDPFFSNNDDMIECVIGITPQVKLNKFSSINFDFTYYFNILQNQAFDWEYSGRDFIGSYFHISIGYTFYFGKQRSILEFPFIFRQKFTRW
jgi:hypothetical protein